MNIKNKNIKDNHKKSEPPDPIQNSQELSQIQQISLSNSRQIVNYFISIFIKNPLCVDFVLKVEKDFINLVNTMSSESFYVHPPCHSFHRMLIIKLASYYDLSCDINPEQEGLFVHCHNFGFLPKSISSIWDENDINRKGKSRSFNQPIRILKNTRREEPPPIPKVKESVPLKSFEERKDSYIKARSRILNVSIEECANQFKDFEIIQEESAKASTKELFFEAINQVAKSPLKGTDIPITRHSHPKSNQRKPQ